MSRHYTFHNNEVTGHEHWATLKGEPEGSHFYSPMDDDEFKWGHTTQLETTGWVATSKEEMPKEFLTQLLLMGVPC